MVFMLRSGAYRLANSGVEIVFLKKLCKKYISFAPARGQGAKCEHLASRTKEHFGIQLACAALTAGQLMRQQEWPCYLFQIEVMHRSIPSPTTQPSRPGCPVGQLDWAMILLFLSSASFRLLLIAEIKFTNSSIKKIATNG